MTQKLVRNVTASVKARLLNYAKEQGLPYNQVAEQFVRERFLYRLSQSPAANRFILKGAMSFVVWTGATHRPTRDLDLLGSGSPQPAEMVRIFRSVCTQEAHDGILFPLDGVTAEPTRPDEEYQGIKVRIIAFMEKSKYTLPIDIGFGDAVVPTPETYSLPMLLEGFPSPWLQVYPKEAAIAEKTQAMVSRGTLNSRLKDFYDIWYLATHFDFDGVLLSQAIAATFHRRLTPIPGVIPVALTPAFADDRTRGAAWNSFLSRNPGMHEEPLPLTDVITVMAEFLMPPLLAARSEMIFNDRWECSRRRWHE